jgi:hypothetical protein
VPAGHPWQHSPWEQGSAELADLCNDEAELEGNFLYQRIWSVAAAAKGGDPCLPASGRSFFNVSNVGTPDWSKVQPGATVDIKLRGWSTGKLPRWWQVTSAVSVSSPAMSGAETTLTSPKPGWFGKCEHLPSVYANDPAGVTLHVTAPQEARSGDWAVVEIDSFIENDVQNCVPVRGQDEAHMWFVGVYVP